MAASSSLRPKRSPKAEKKLKAKKIPTKGKEGALLGMATKIAKIRRSGPGRKGGLDISPTSVLRATEKACNAALLIMERCMACHGQSVRGVIGSMVNNGGRYSMADLKYDIKHGRLELLPPGSPAGDMPQGKPRADAPLAGKPLPPANLDEFFQFLQCQLKMEALEHTGKDIQVLGKEAQNMWPEVKAHTIPNLGKTERWVPYHTVLGVHELFLVESVHHNKKTGWNEKQRFMAMFVFRAHCKRDLFLKAQVPLMTSGAFWNNPGKAFRPGGPMEAAILNYRRKTGNPLLTSCFRIIPERVLKDDTENLVRSITSRTQVLLEVAEAAFPVIKNTKLTASEKLSTISNMVRNAKGAGDTWAKMLTVCIDLAYPKERLLASQCDVGTGAEKPLRCLLPRGGSADKMEALSALLKIANASKSDATKKFWAVLKKEEALIRAKFKHLPLICAQSTTREGGMSAVTLQVQLCEYRQFRHSLARHVYGLPDDESMRVDPEKETRLCPEDFIDYDQKGRCMTFEFPSGGKKIPFEVSVAAAGGHQMVAERVASMCFCKLRGGASKAEALQYRDELLADCRGGEDVPLDSEAWRVCKCALSHPSPCVSFSFEHKNGSKFPFQTTKGAAGGILEMERIARLCWEKLNSGFTKEAALAYRNKLYKLCNGDRAGAPPAKRKKAA